MVWEYNLNQICLWFMWLLSLIIRSKDCKTSTCFCPCSSIVFVCFPNVFPREEHEDVASVIFCYGWCSISSPVRYSCLSFLLWGKSGINDQKQVWLCWILSVKSLKFIKVNFRWEVNSNLRKSLSVTSFGIGKFDCVVNSKEIFSFQFLINNLVTTELFSSRIISVMKSSNIIKMFFFNLVPRAVLEK